MVATPFQKQGYATEAAEGLIRFAKATLGAKRFMAFPSTANPASNRVVEKLGFQFVKETPYEYLGRELQSSFWELNT